jgi:iron complex transport system ATP-binding protein
MIQIRSVEFEYLPGIPVLGDISLEIAGGELHCLLGPNGSGKTTLLHLILGYLKPLSGSIAIDGEDLASLSPARRSRLCAYVPQAQDYAYNYSVLDAVLMGRAAGRPGWFIPGDTDRLAAEGALQRLGLEELADRRLHTLSAGELQLTGIARSLCREPKVLLLDEPESHLDPARDRRLHAILGDLAAGGMTVLLTSHNPLLVSRYAHRVTGLANGRVEASGEPAKVLRAEVLKRLYGIAYREFGDGDTLYPVPDYDLP